MKRSLKPNRLFNQVRIRTLFLPLIILIIGIAVSLLAEQKAQNKQLELVTNTLKHDLRNIRADFNQRLTFYSYGLTGLHGLVSTIGLDNFDYQTMVNYAENRNFQEEFPGVRGLGFIQRVEQNQLADFLYTQRQMRPDRQFDLKQLNSHSDNLFIIRFIEPEDNNKSAVGLDIGSENMRRNAAIEAAKNNEVQITAPITLVQANKKEKQGFLILLPLYDTTTLPISPEAKLDHLLGWIYAPILIGEVLNSNTDFPKDVDVKISDVTTTNGKVFYEQKSENSVLSPFVYTESVEVFGRVWELTLSAQQNYIERVKTKQDYVTFVQYLIISALIALIFLTVHLALLRREQMQGYEQALVIAKEKALKVANEQLEDLVAKRTIEIHEAHALQNAILNNANYSVIATDKTGIITSFNPAAERLLGYRATDLIGKETPALFHVESEIHERAKALSKELQCQFENSMEVFFAKSDRGLEDNSNWTYVSKSGQHIPVMLNLTALIIEHNEITGYLGIAYDLTEQIQKENALAEAKVAAEKANLAKSEFLANMSHEIRTPLNGIFGTLQLLQQATTVVEQSKLIMLAEKSSMTLNRLVNDILDFSKFEAGKLDLEICPIDLPILIGEIELESKPSVQQKNLAFNVNINLKNAVWMTDELRIKQILLNLLSNAIKFTHEGEINLTISEQDGNGITLTVEDSGIGMNEASLKRLFQRFEQADKSITRRYGGTGLGMSITQSLVHLMNGEISVASEENIGTSVTVFLPLVAVNAQKTTAPDADEPCIEQNEKTILIAEDNDINQVILSTMLATRYSNIHIVENGQLAVEFAETRHLDIILMDIQMPIMDGIEACKRIKFLHPSIPIIAITANVFEEDIALYKAAGFDAYIAKPFQKNHLFEILQKALRNGE
jgi:PAS domain S-box-containing protein